MSNLVNASLNVFPSVMKEIPAKNVPIFTHVYERYPAGATLAVTPNTVIPAGTPVSIDKLGGTATVITKSTAEASTPIGLIENDVYSTVAGTAAVDIVVRGQVLVDRCPEATEAVKAKLPLITFVSEK